MPYKLTVNTLEMEKTFLSLLPPALQRLNVISRTLSAVIDSKKLMKFAACALKNQLPFADFITQRQRSTGKQRS